MNSLRSLLPTALRATPHKLLLNRSLRPFNRTYSSFLVSSSPRGSLHSPYRRFQGQAGRNNNFARTLFIQTEDTPNVDSLKFIPGHPVMSAAGGGTAEFLTPSDAIRSPLADRLLNIEGVQSVFYGPDFITVNKAPEASWSLIKPELFSFMMDHFVSGQLLFKEGSAGGNEDTKILEDDSETVAMIKELLETRVRPAIQEDGGDIEYMGFDETNGSVKVKLKGSCRGCDSSTVTLKSGIERMLMHYVPEVKAVEQVLGPEEAVANDEFAKFEERLRASGKTVSV
ncbi:HIRA-interacting protein 5 [Atractiella rhizophila]|nr:HIRA-interacting protein 5 [Atractiella rhizophila]